MAVVPGLQILFPEFGGQLCGFWFSLYRDIWGILIGVGGRGTQSLSKELVL